MNEIKIFMYFLNNEEFFDWIIFYHANMIFIQHCFWNLLANRVYVCFSSVWYDVIISSKSFLDLYKSAT